MIAVAEGAVGAALLGVLSQVSVSRVIRHARTFPRQRSVDRRASTTDASGCFAFEAGRRTFATRPAVTKADDAAQPPRVASVDSASMLARDEQSDDLEETTVSGRSLEQGSTSPSSDPPTSDSQPSSVAASSAQDSAGSTIHPRLPSPAGGLPVQERRRRPPFVFAPSPGSGGLTQNGAQVSRSRNAPLYRSVVGQRVPHKERFGTNGTDRTSAASSQGVTPSARMASPSRPESDSGLSLSECSREEYPSRLASTINRYTRQRKPPFSSQEKGPLGATSDSHLLTLLIGHCHAHRHLTSTAAYDVLLAFAYRLSNLAAVRKILKRMEEQRLPWSNDTPKIVYRGQVLRSGLLPSPQRRLAAARPSKLKGAARPRSPAQARWVASQEAASGKHRAHKSAVMLVEERAASLAKKIARRAVVAGDTEWASIVLTGGPWVQLRVGTATKDAMTTAEHTSKKESRAVGGATGDLSLRKVGIGRPPSPRDIATIMQTFEGDQNDVAAMTPEIFVALLRYVLASTPEHFPSLEASIAAFQGLVGPHFDANSPTTGVNHLDVLHLYLHPSLGQSPLALLKQYLACTAGTTSAPQPMGRTLTLALRCLKGKLRPAATAREIIEWYQEQRLGRYITREHWTQVLTLIRRSGDEQEGYPSLVAWATQQAQECVKTVEAATSAGQPSKSTRYELDFRFSRAGRHDWAFDKAKRKLGIV